MRNPNPPYIYFASDSLACIRDTRGLALTHGLIWRPLNDSLYDLQPGDHLLLAFWMAAKRHFVPLARFKTRQLDAAQDEQPCQAGACYCEIPAQILQAFLAAVPGQGGGHGYIAAENPGLTAICVEQLQLNDAVD